MRDALLHCVIEGEALNEIELCTFFLILIAGAIRHAALAELGSGFSGGERRCRIENVDHGGRHVALRRMRLSESPRARAASKW